MSEFIDAIRVAAERILRRCPQARYEWERNEARKSETLTIHRSSDRGFDVRLECQTYGLYPHAGEWQGSPWDDGFWSAEKIQREVEEFLTSVLSMDAELEVHSSNGKPCRWILHHRFQGERISDAYGSTLFRFGRRSVETFQNNFLIAPP